MILEQYYLSRHQMIRLQSRAISFGASQFSFGASQSKQVIAMQTSTSEIILDLAEQKQVQH